MSIPKIPHKCPICQLDIVGICDIATDQYDFYCSRDHKPHYSIRREIVPLFVSCPNRPLCDDEDCYFCNRSGPFKTKLEYVEYCRIGEYVIVNDYIENSSIISIFEPKNSLGVYDVDDGYDFLVKFENTIPINVNIRDRIKSLLLFT